MYKCNLQRIGYAEIDEAYTSKTCSNCGFMNDNLGASKIFKCNICELKIDRDCNGARNIMINCNG
jgi:putative transposase